MSANEPKTATEAMIYLGNGAGVAARRERALHVAEVIRPNDGEKGIVQIDAGWLREAADIIEALLKPPAPVEGNARILAGPK